MPYGMRAARTQSRRVERIAVVDDGAVITITVYGGTESISAEVDPRRALMLASELIAAALPKLSPT
jgi:hypothetical protein